MSNGVPFGEVEIPGLGGVFVDTREERSEIFYVGSRSHSGKITGENRQHFGSRGCPMS